MEEEKVETTGVRKANEFNSTDFTICCGLAVVSECAESCPGCGAKVIK